MSNAQRQNSHDEKNIQITKGNIEGNKSPIQSKWVKSDWRDWKQQEQLLLFNKNQNTVLLHISKKATQQSKQEFGSLWGDEMGNL